MIESVNSATVAYFGTGSPHHPSRSDRLAAPPAHSRHKNDASASDPDGRPSAAKRARGPNELTPDEKQQVEKLAARDAEVRTHEMAHLAAAGSLAMGGPNYVYQTGPDGKNYAIGGSVKIDTSPGRTPEETLRKSQQIRAAALAPSDPSPQDLKVAASAASMGIEAQSKSNEKAREANQPTDDAGESADIRSSRQIPAPSGEPQDPYAEQGPRSDFYAQRAASLYQRASGN